jgi:hypothetical protein
VMKVPALDAGFAPGFAQRGLFRSKRGYGEYLSCRLDYGKHESNCRLKFKSTINCMPEKKC